MAVIDGGDTQNPLTVILGVRRFVPACGRFTNTAKDGRLTRLFVFGETGFCIA
jgi:hypothetical protein